MRALSILLVFGLAACGTGSTTTNDGGNGETGGGDGGCIQATEGASCNANDVACSLGGDVCCDGFLQCVSGHWMKEYPGCACQTGTFACGTETCTAAQICKTQESGVDGGAATSSCASVPTECATNASCGCVADSGVCAPTVIASCMDSQGHLLVDCMGQ